MPKKRPPPFLINKTPTCSDLPPTHPNFITGMINGASLRHHTDTHWRLNPHEHPTNYALWGFKVASPPLKDSPKAFPRNRVKLWPAAPFTLDIGLKPCGGGVPVFSGFEVDQDGSAALPPCYYHRVLSNTSKCPHKRRVAPLRTVGTPLPDLKTEPQTPPTDGARPAKKLRISTSLANAASTSTAILTPPPSGPSSSSSSRAAAQSDSGGVDIAPRSATMAPTTGVILRLPRRGAHWEPDSRSPQRQHQRHSPPFPREQKVNMGDVLHETQRFTVQRLPPIPKNRPRTWMRDAQITSERLKLNRSRVDELERENARIRAERKRDREHLGEMRYARAGDQKKMTILDELDANAAIQPLPANSNIVAQAHIAHLEGRNADLQQAKAESDMAYSQIVAENEELRRRAAEDSKKMAALVAENQSVKWEWMEERATVATLRADNAWLRQSIGVDGKAAHESSSRKRKYWNSEAAL